jgi:hypothetical protein
MILASLESFLGSLWFAGFAAVLGYVVGNIFPVSWLARLRKKHW